jgi:hypothetical protein
MAFTITQLPVDGAVAGTVHWSCCVGPASSPPVSVDDEPESVDDPESVPDSETELPESTALDPSG